MENKKLKIKDVKHIIKTIINSISGRKYKLNKYSDLKSGLLSGAKSIKYHSKIWLLMSKNSFMVMLAQKKLFALFLLGKSLRFIFFLIFLLFLVKGATALANYNVNQIIFFFLTFNTIDVVSQFFFREVYRFRPLIISGDFDLILIKPTNALFRVLMGGSDVVDFITIPPIIFALIYVGSTLHPSALQIIFFLFLLVNSLLIATAFHIIVLAIGILAMEVDHIVWLYRDVTSLGRLPIDIYRQPIRNIITYLVPVGIMLTYPAKAFMGVLSPIGIFSSFMLAGFSIFLSLKIWKISLKRYTSASS